MKDMKEILTLRVSSEYKNELQAQAKAKGFKSSAEFVRYLMERGREATELSKSEYHMLAQCIQSVLLLREILSTISSDTTSSNQIIDTVRADATAWVNKFNQSISGQIEA